MNRAQQRMHEYRRQGAVRGIPAPELARGAIVGARGGRAVWRINQLGFEAEISMPRRPRGWIVGGAEAPEPDGYATLRVAAATPDAIVEARAWLASLPEARGLPVAVCGGVEALRAAAMLGPAVDALILEGDADGPPVLIPTRVPADEASIESFLDAEVGQRAPQLNHRQRRLLARRLGRGLRGEVRGLRAAIATLASALAMTISMGLLAAPADAVFIPAYDSSVGAGNRLTFTDDDLPTAANAVTLDCDVGGDVIYDTGAGPTTIPGPGGGPTFHLDCIEVQSISVIGNGGNDTIELQPASVSDYLFLSSSGSATGVDVTGGNGGDDIDGVAGFANSLRGDAGGDTLSGDSQDDTLVPGSGNDSIGGQGGTRDLLDLSGETTGGTIDLAAGTATLGGDVDSLASVEDALGTTGADAITAVAAGSSVQGGGSADTLTGGAGSDSLFGEAGTDDLDGAGAADTLDGGSEADTLAGGTGTVTDTLAGGAGTDSLNGQAGGDTMGGGSEDDTLVAGDGGDDTLNGESGTGDLASYAAAGAAVDVNLSLGSATGAGTDQLTSIEGAAGSGQADTLTGSSAANTLIGNGGADTVSANAGTDSVTGDAGTDDIDGGGSDDTLDGGAANDTLDPSTGTAGEVLSGGTEDDQLLAPSFGSTLSGNDGQDTIEGSTQADSIDAGNGPDTVDANNGSDTVSGSGGDDTLLGDQDNDSVLGGTENDTIDGRFGFDTLLGEGGTDTLRGGSIDPDSLLGGAGSADRLVQDAFPVNPSLSDTLITGDGPDTLDGLIETASLGGTGVLDASAFTLGSVTLNAGSGPATLRGGSGSDSILGSGSVDRLEQTVDANQTLTDTLLTGEGNDTLSGIFRVSLTGGAGANALNAAAWSGLDTTLDGQGANDTLTAGANNSANDSLVGSSGTDRIVVSRNISMTLTDTQFTGLADVDTLASIEQASLAGGTGFNDLDASAFTGSTTLDGGDGSDTIAGAAGGDSLIGGIGSDRIEQTTDAASQTLANGAATGDGNDTLSTFETASLTGGASANLISASSFTGGQVTIAGLGGNDTITGTLTDDLLDGGANTDRILNTADAQQTLTNTSLTTGGVVQDTLAAFEQAALTGGAADNPLNAGAFSGPVTLTGLGGDDFLTGTANSDSLDGGAEVNGDSAGQTADANQTLTDTQLTGAGTDTIASLEIVSMAGGNGSNDLDASAFSGRVDLSGGSGNDTLAGAAGNDTLQGAGDTDRIEQTSNAASQVLDNSSATGDGADFIDQIEQASLTGGGSANTIVASAFTGGPVTMVGLGAPDTLTGTGVADSLDGGTEGDSISAGGADDTISGGDGGDVLNGAAGTDRLVEVADAGMTLADNALSGNGNDTLDGQIERASLTGGAGANALSAASFTLGAVSLDGQAGADTLIGSAQGDSLAGSTENDVLRGGGATDSIDGGGGVDTADYADDPGAGAIQANLGSGQITGAQAETLGAIENLIGTSFGDALTGSGAANALVGGPGPDTLTGGGGSDTMQGNAGNDVHNSQDGGTADTNDCGADSDTANADVQDTTANCETVANPAAGQPGGPPLQPPPNPPADTKAPAISLSGKSKQKDKTQVKATVSCDEACTVEATGTIKVPEIKDKGRGKRAKSKRFDLKRASASLTAGQSQTLKLKLSGKAKKALKKAIKKKASSAKVTATATDPAGNAATSPTLKIKVKK